MPNKKQIQNLFKTIATTYDFLNHILSFGMDNYWWKKMALMSGATKECLFLDVASGTGYSSMALTRLGAEVIAIDITNTMLKLGIKNFKRYKQEKRILASIEADAINLPFKNDTFDGITICYGIRNINNRHKAYKEFIRVLKPNKYLTILEFSKPKSILAQALYTTYMKNIMPNIAKLISRTPEAYSYLYQSIIKFPNKEFITEELKNEGFKTISCKELTYGIVTIYKAQK